MVPAKSLVNTLLSYYLAYSSPNECYIIEQRPERYAIPTVLGQPLLGRREKSVAGDDMYDTAPSQHLMAAGSTVDDLQ